MGKEALVLIELLHWLTRIMREGAMGECADFMFACFIIGGLLAWVSHR